jgi:hypothetical protein
LSKSSSSKASTPEPVPERPAALRSLAARRQLLTQMGVKLAADEDPYEE